jgi:predicted metal-dependent hydrolase
MHALVREKAEWILLKLQEYEETERQKPRLRFSDGATLDIHGEAHVLRVAVWANARGRVRLEAGTLRIDVPRTHAGHAAVLRTLCEAWMKQYARWYLQQRIMQLGAAMGKSPVRITVRRQTSKWGSCTAKSAISLNMLLVCLPRDTCDYVLIHELAHLQQLNHSRRFWSIVEKACPDYRRQRALLREFSWLLDAWDGDPAR